MLGLLGPLYVLGISANTSPMPDQHISGTATPGSRTDWTYQKEDPKTRKKLVLINAKAWERISHPSVFRLKGVTGKVYSPASSSYTDLHLKSAVFDEKSGVLIYGEDLTVVTLP
ncbi:MAG: hypothetical protein M3Y72_15185 [Acidobacteriota bacterium]|nr:hypothetical protein [Acidobacteriota bacterium]